MSNITTHVLDLTNGTPAEGIKAKLFFYENSVWKQIAHGTTGRDGRILDLMDKAELLRKGIYKMEFKTGDYYDQKKIKSFYPYIEITFTINDEEHYHIPLLLNAFGYTTYRGS
ncbi:MAG: hydroxyisourate hydrolase [Ignavibacteria bacterium]